MLNKLDDYPIHQTPEPIAQPLTGDRNVYDRYWFNGFTREADLFFAVALGVYPNRRVMDAAVSVVRGGVQYVVRGSRLAPDERTDTRAGPISIEVQEPMRTLRIRIAPNPHGLVGELTFRARTEALEEPRFTLRRRQPHLPRLDALHAVRHVGGVARGRFGTDQARSESRARHARSLLGYASGRRARDDGRAGSAAAVLSGSGRRFSSKTAACTSRSMKTLRAAP